MWLGERITDYGVGNGQSMIIFAGILATAGNMIVGKFKNVFDGNNEIFENGDDSFVPLVAYKILYDLSERANEGVWNLYLLADASIIDAIAAALELNGDEELSNAFKYLHENANGDFERTEKFLLDNRKYIQAKMVKYVKANIDRF